MGGGAASGAGGGGVLYWLAPMLNTANVGAFFTQFQADVQTPSFWLAVGKIIWINVLLSGDNALVIALACRGLHPRQRVWGMVIGAGIAVVLLILFTGIVATLMVLPYLKLIGGLALLAIAAKLLVPEDSRKHITEGPHPRPAPRLLADPPIRLGPAHDHVDPPPP